jgi:hemerythrin superfamily protein
MPSRKQEKGGSQDAIQLLRKDHEDVNRMFEEFEKADEDRKFELAADICQALTVHATIEEEIFYPQVREVIDAEDMMIEAEIEHDSARHLIEKIQEGEVDEVQLSAMIKVLQEYVNHHVNEEQRRMFPRVRKAGLDLQALGQELLERKTELESELGSAADDSSGTRALTDDADVDAVAVDDDEEDEGGPERSRGGMAASERDEYEDD